LFTYAIKGLRQHTITMTLYIHGAYNLNTSWFCYNTV